MHQVINAIDQVWRQWLHRKAMQKAVQTADHGKFTWQCYQSLTFLRES
jgi:hypothetical protein